MLETLEEDGAERTSTHIFEAILKAMKEQPNNPVIQTRTSENGTTYRVVIVNVEARYATLIETDDYTILAQGDDMDTELRDLKRQINESVLSTQIGQEQVRQIVETARSQFARFPVNVEWLSEDLSAIFDKSLVLTSMTFGV